MKPLLFLTLVGCSSATPYTLSDADVPEDSAPDAALPDSDLPDSDSALPDTALPYSWYCAQTTPSSCECLYAQTAPDPFVKDAQCPASWSCRMYNSACVCAEVAPDASAGIPVSRCHQ